MKIVVAFDGTIQSREALAYGMQKARDKKAELMVLHVFNSPSFVDYDASIHAENVGRAESARFVQEAKDLIKAKGAGLNASLYTTEGNPQDEVLRFAKEQGADILLCPPTYGRIIKKYRKALEKEGRAVGTADLADADRLDLAAVAAVSKRS